MRTFNINSRYMHVKDAVLNAGQYADGSLAIFVDDEDEEGYPNTEKLSINLGAYGETPTEPHTIYVPDYAENEGLPEALVEAGIATYVGTRDEAGVMFGYDATAYLMRLTDEAIAAVSA